MGLPVLHAAGTWPPHGNGEEVSFTEPHPVPVLALHYVGILDWAVDS